MGQVLIDEHLEADAFARIAMRDQSADARLDRIALIERPGERGIFGARHIAKRFAPPLDTHGAGIMRITRFPHQFKSIANPKSLPYAVPGVVPKTGKRRVLNENAGMLSRGTWRIRKACERDEDDRGEPVGIDSVALHRGQSRAIVVKGIANPLNVLAIRARHDHDVESARPAMLAGEKVTRRMDDAPLFVMVDACACAAKMLAATHPHFHKDKGLAIVGDEVDFAAATAKVALNDAMRACFEVACRERLARRAASSARRGGYVWRWHWRRC